MPDERRRWTRKDLNDYIDLLVKNLEAERAKTEALKLQAERDQNKLRRLGHLPGGPQDDYMLGDFVVDSNDSTLEAERAANERVRTWRADV